MDIRIINETDGKAVVATRPHSIELISGTARGFAKFEVEEVAGKLVQYFQYQGRWCAFRLSHLMEFYRHKGWDPDVSLYGLIGPWFDDMDLGVVRHGDPPYLVLFPDGHICVTTAFIDTCKKREPAAA